MFFLPLLDYLDASEHTIGPLEQRSAISTCASSLASFTWRRISLLLRQILATV